MAGLCRVHRQVDGKHNESVGLFTWEDLAERVRGGYDRPDHGGSMYTPPMYFYWL